MTRTTARFGRIAGGLIAATLALTACSNGSDSSTASDASSSSSSADESANFNDADVTFVQGMLPHHRGALEMAQLAEGRAQDPRVLDLASRIEAAQDPEIQTMTGWLEDWGKTESDSMGGMDMGDMDMGGMDMDTSSLETASGAEFDRLFLQMMTEHHSGAVDMAKTEIADGQNPDAIDLARSIEESQTAEIQEMQTLLTELGS